MSCRTCRLLLIISDTLSCRTHKLLLIISDTLSCRTYKLLFIISDLVSCRTYKLLLIISDTLSCRTYKLLLIIFAVVLLYPENTDATMRHKMFRISYKTFHPNWVSRIAYTEIHRNSFLVFIFYFCGHSCNQQCCKDDKTVCYVSNMLTNKVRTVPFKALYSLNSTS